MPDSEITGVILAGGLARRMGGVDKGRQLLDGKPLVEHVAARLAPQVGTLLINANRSQSDYATLGYRLIGDALPDGVTFTRRCSPLVARSGGPAARCTWPTRRATCHRHSRRAPAPGLLSVPPGSA